MKSYYLLILVLIFSFQKSISQTAISFGVSNRTMVSTEQMPFWMWANNDGKINKDNSFLNLSELEVAGKYFFNDSNSFFQAGTNLIAGLGNKNSYFQPNQLFAGINLNNWELNTGMYYNEEQFGGLSTSNGNMANSRNARPHPRIVARVAKFKPVPYLGNFLWFKGEYEEGLLLDERYVDKTHLHHKSFYLKLQAFKNFNIQAGLEHFVMWGGTSQNENIGKLPDDFDAYWKYIRGANGDDSFPTTDQLNVAGNSYGTYQILFTKKFKKLEASINVSHPFEDYSGINWRNWPDNMIGLYIKLNEPNKFITHILYEFTNTRQQGITDSLYRWIDDEQKWHRIDEDNYFNHGIYRSGVTYHQQTINSPLFFPVIVRENISRGTESNRFFAHHMGIKGILWKEIAWKGMMTYIQHYGTYSNPYEPKYKQISGFLELFYSGAFLPVNIGLTFTGDLANTTQDKLGIQLTFSKTW